LAGGAHGAHLAMAGHAAHLAHGALLAHGGKVAHMQSHAVMIEHPGMHGNFAPHSVAGHMMKNLGAGPHGNHGFNKEHMAAHMPPSLPWKGVHGEVPHAGGPKVGHAGLIDPGKFIRSGEHPNGKFTREFMRGQLATIPNFRDVQAQNLRLRMHYNEWPGQWRPGFNWSTWVNPLAYYNGYYWGGQTYPWNYYALSDYV